MLTRSQYALAGFSVYVAADVAFWARGDAGRGFAIAVILPVLPLTFAFIAIAVALAPGRYPVLASAGVSGAAVVAAWLAKAPLALLLPGLVQRDHDAWVAGLVWESMMVGGHAAVAAAMLAAGARLVARHWSRHHASPGTSEAEPGSARD